MAGGAESDRKGGRTAAGNRWQDEQVWESYRCGGNSVHRTVLAERGYAGRV